MRVPIPSKLKLVALVSVTEVAKVPPLVGLRHVTVIAMVLLAAR